MKKLIIILVLFFTSYCVFLRKTNYDEALLDNCLNENNLKLGDSLKTLLALYNEGRHFLFGKECEAMNLDESSQELIKKCFASYGIYNQFGDCTRNCYDKCDYYHKEDKYCYHRCPIC